MCSRRTDGGKTWKRVFFVNDKLGVIDLVMNPQNPDVLYAATYDMQRTPWMHRNAGPDSGIYKTIDGGGNLDEAHERTAHRSHRQDRPRHLARNPEVLYAALVNANPGPTPGTPGGCTGGQRAGLDWRRDLSHRQRRRERGPRVNSASDDLTPKGSGYMGSGDEDCDGFTQVRIDPNNDQRVFMVSNSLLHSTDGGKTWRGGGGSRPPGLFPEHLRRCAHLLDRSAGLRPHDHRRRWRLRLSHDGGKSSDHISHLPIGEPYAVGYDMEDPYNIYASLQDHEDWKGPSIGPMGFTSLLDWFAISSGDGMHTRVDPADSRWAYTSSEWGGVFRTDQKLGYRVNIRPTRPGGGPPYRSIWGTPLHLSPHNGSIALHRRRSPPQVRRPRRSLDRDQSVT